MTSTSFWQATAGRRSATAPTVNDVDCLIVGGGIAGASAAYALAQAKPDWKLAVVDRRRIAGGATGRNAGFLLAGTADHYAVAVARYGRETARAVFATTVDSHHHIRTFLAHHPAVDCDYIPCGSLTLAGTAEEAEVLAHSAELLREDGFDVEFVPHDPLQRGFCAAIRNRHDAGIHPVRLVQAMLDASGAVIVEDWPVTTFETTPAGVVVQGERGQLRAGRVLLTPNGEAASLHPYFADKVFPKRGQVFVTAPYPGRLLSEVVYANDGYEYFRQLPDGRFLFGGGRRAFAATETGTDETPTADVQNFLERFKDRHFPELTGFPITHRWAGTMGFTPDGLPLLGTLPNHPRIAFSIACHGHGMGFSLEVGRLAAELVITGKPLELFDVVRLERNPASRPAAYV
ncbi:FAD-binding oxidoreductase [Chloracidobacterium sp. MS 40/45]|uniref:NAD(P)/FAD-dependent oxidoreductase n=1 Tax=Chloracidobacterium aggregatum TaxID=2851959 RepID=UPI001B8CC68A|nr:FAD-binding oxidoreductase [Chloracidobacterium aggregatum]QUV99252.1 FAD-binding oxidoreductase [Chloracidobacterium sp. MS 40/45]